LGKRSEEERLKYLAEEHDNLGHIFEKTRRKPLAAWGGCLAYLEGVEVEVDAE
jgi:hypothetical protein